MDANGFLVMHRKMLLFTIYPSRKDFFFIVCGTVHVKKSVLKETAAFLKLVNFYDTYHNLTRPLWHFMHTSTILWFTETLLQPPVSCQI